MDVRHGKQVVQPLLDIILAVSRRLRRLTAPRTLALLPILTALGAAGCVQTKNIPENQRMLKSYPFSKEQAIARLENLSKSIQTIQTGITLEGSTAVLSDATKRKVAPSLGGTLILQNTGEIRLKAGFAVVDAFNIVSNGTDYQVWVNRKDGELYQGSENAPPSKPFKHLNELENQFVSMRPRQIHDALLMNVTALIKESSIVVTPYVLPVAKDQRKYFILDFTDVSSIHEPRLVQKIWFDLSTEKIDIARRQTFDRSGEVETDTQYSAFEPVGSAGVRYPGKIDIKFVPTDTDLKISMNPQGIRINRLDSRAAFELEPHEGAKIFKFEPQVAGVGVSSQR